MEFTSMNYQVEVPRKEKQPQTERSMGTYDDSQIQCIIPHNEISSSRQRKKLLSLDQFFICNINLD